MTGKAWMTGGEPREIAGITTRLIVDHIRRHGGEGAVQELLELAGETRPLRVLEDESSWSSYDQMIALFEAARWITGDPEIARRIGEGVLDAGVGASLKLLLSYLGSPGQVLRSVAKASAKFTTCSTMRSVTVSRQHGVIAYRLHEGYEPSRHDCLYNIGLLSQVSALFGLPAAIVRHEACQLEGAPECVYHVSWRPRRRWWHRLLRHEPNTTHSEVELAALREQLDDLRRTVGELVATDDIDTSLRQVAVHASRAVAAQRFLFAIRIEGEPRPRVVAEGFPADELRARGQALLDAPTPDEAAEPWSIVVDVASARYRYGRLAAYLPQDQSFFSHERELLAAYAGLAAVALDATTALEQAHSRGHMAEVLLDLAHSLAMTERVTDICQTVTRAVPDIVGAQRSSLMLLDEETKQLRVCGSFGFPPELAERLDAFTVSERDTPELARMLNRPRPVFYTREDEDPFIHANLDAFGSEAIVVLPIVGQRGFLGILLAGWERGAPVPSADGFLYSRLMGVADQAATSIANARLMDRVRYQATHDALTRLPNRLLFEDRIERSLASTRRSGDKFAVLFVDLDRFKRINDGFGHATGDEIIRQAARRLEGCVREVDSVARLGGDEFVVLVADVESTHDAESAAQRIVDAFAMPFVIGANEFEVSASVGVATAPRDGESVAELLRNADNAMYAMKAAGRNGWRVYDENVADAEAERRALESELAEAIRHEDFVLHFQPQVELSNGRLFGVEALVRWRHPTRGLIPPGTFLPLAEETGLVVPLDLLVIHKACEQGAQWERDEAPDLRIAVNVSAQTVRDDRFVPGVMAALEQTGFDPARLEFELTERRALDDVDRARLAFDKLTSIGCQLVIDDVGTGYTSFTRLQRLPVTRLKIDRSFVEELAGLGGEGASIVAAVLALGRQMGHHVLAEGVETLDQLQALLDQGCVEGQGYLFAAPLEPGEVMGAAVAGLHRAAQGDAAADDPIVTEPDDVTDLGDVEDLAG